MSHDYPTTSNVLLYEAISISLKVSLDEYLGFDGDIFRCDGTKYQVPKGNIPENQFSLSPPQ